METLTYLKRLFTAENASILGVNYNFKLLHAISSISQERGKQLKEFISDRHGTFLERDFGVLDICNASRCTWDKLMSQFLQSRERPKEIR